MLDLLVLFVFVFEAGDGGEAAGQDHRPLRMRDHHQDHQHLQHQHQHPHASLPAMPGPAAAAAAASHFSPAVGLATPAVTGLNTLSDFLCTPRARAAAVLAHRRSLPPVTNHLQQIEPFHPRLLESSPGAATCLSTTCRIPCCPVPPIRFESVPPYARRYKIQTTAVMVKSKRARDAVDADEHTHVDAVDVPPKKRSKRSSADDDAVAGAGAGADVDVKQAKKDKKDKDKKEKDKKDKKKKKFDKESRKAKKEKRKDLQDLPEQDSDNDNDAEDDSPMADADAQPKPAAAAADADAEKAAKKIKKKEKKEKKQKKQDSDTAAATSTITAAVDVVASDKSDDKEPTNGTDAPKKSKKDKKKNKKQKQETDDTTTTTNGAEPSPEDASAPAAEDDAASSKADRHIVFVGNLPFSATVATITEHFASLSPVSVRCLRNKDDPNPCRGIAFVEFGKVWHQRTCLDKFHHSMFDDGQSPARKINVELTAGGGGKSKVRQEKIKEKNIKLDENRTKRIEKEKTDKAKPAAGKDAKAPAESTAHLEEYIHPSRRARVPDNGR
ncbi:hypothetical protein G7046_g1597 [Stylonectria norvegica]|nr:hypothetical protein G7046_g1597 [Stylonectria norvegica]